MTIIVNGQPRELSADTTVEGLLSELGMRSGPCAVEVDRVLVPKARHAEHRLTEGARVEIVTLVGGG